MKTRILALAAVSLLALALPATAEIKDRNIRVSNGVNADHPVGDGVKAMTQCVTDKSGGKIKLTAFWGGALGGDLQATQALRSGTQEMVITSTSPLVGIAPALGVFDLPFLFANEKEADAVLDGEFGKHVSDMLPNYGLVNLAYWENGFRNLTNSKVPVEKWEDLNGMKVRVMQNNIFLDTFKNMGANATPMAFGEVFAALETKAIDAQENPFVTIDTSKFYEVQNYLSVTRHAYTPFMVLFSKPIWDTYSPEEQTILSECAVVGRDAQRKASRELSEKSLAKLKEAGMKVNELSPDEQNRMREKAQVVYEKHAGSIGADVVKRIQDALAEVRKN
ncbi:tripartite ATP-independent transporter DctP family solute receptor [Chelatococcus caeni]|uniref:Tripartite ATP-independent transporter DctP family solute receptor n=1 Tax=Chelatococcus caeni TaxID=1348468 RepID=A0A840C4K2_9HYPH|nr:TRAP transporter substrate-binding protein [Chelatococcus caeni]MBB4018548.1 tripartite ATP-independent transporter DctP family solute receptor [Chelatococcus caeni]